MADRHGDHGPQRVRALPGRALVHHAAAAGRRFDPVRAAEVVDWAVDLASMLASVNLQLQLGDVTFNRLDTASVIPFSYPGWEPPRRPAVNEDELSYITEAAEHLLAVVLLFTQLTLVPVSWPTTGRPAGRADPPTSFVVNNFLSNSA